MDFKIHFKKSLWSYVLSNPTFYKSYIQNDVVEKSAILDKDGP